MKGGTAQTQAEDRSLEDAVDNALTVKFDDFRTFLKSVSANLSLDGMFVNTPEPQPPGTEIAFELSLRDGHPLISGSGTVAWSRTAGDEGDEEGVAGMAIRFLSLDPRSTRLVGRIVEERSKAGLQTLDLDQELSAGQAPVSAAPTERGGSQARAAREDAEDEIESLRAEIERLKAEHAEERERWQGELEVLREAESDLNTRLSDSLSRVIVASEARDGLSSRLAAAEEAFRQDRQRLEELEAERSTLNQQVEELGAEITRWTEEAVAASTGREALERQANGLEEEVEVERERAERLAAELEELKGSSNGRLEEAEAALSAQEAASESMEEDLREAKAAVEQLEAEAEAARATESALRESLEEARCELEDERGQHTQSAAKATELEQEAERLSSELDETRGRCETHQAEAESIRSEMERLKSRHDELEAKISTTRDVAVCAEELFGRLCAEHASLHGDLVEAQKVLAELAEPESPVDDQSDRTRLTIVDAPPTALDSSDAVETAPTASSFRARLANLAGRLRGGRRTGEDMNPYLYSFANDHTAAEAEADETGSEADEAGPEADEVEFVAEVSEAEADEVEPEAGEVQPEADEVDLEADEVERAADVEAR